MQKIDFFFDFETRSRVDLKKVGTVNYATHPSTEATLLTWCFGRTAPVKAWRMGQPIPKDIIDVAENPSKYNIIAHNVQFDYLIWTLPFRRLIPSMVKPTIKDITDNMAHTCHYRCGASLNNAASILGLPTSKDKEGRRIMLKQCKVNSRTGEFPELTDEEWDKFEYYGIVDTKLLRQTYYLTPPLPAPERYIWEWTITRNLRGIKVDTDLVKVMSEILEEEKPKLVKEFELLVGGKVKINSPKAKDWFKQYYPYVENMQADTIRTMMADNRKSIPPFARRALECKALAGSTSLAKINKANTYLHKGRIYELLAYHYAQTKRWAGRGIQIQNFPRPERKDDPIDFNLDQASIHSIIRERRERLIDPLGFIKNLLRRIWLPESGELFYCGDWSKIEPTVLFWLVGLGKIPKLWYAEMAATIYGVAVSSIGPESEERQLGKSAALGCVAGGTEVFTDKGWIRIENIEIGDKVWDGTGYVNHAGLSRNGMKTVMRIEKLNINATPDHLFLTKKGWLTSVEMEVGVGMNPLESDMCLEDGQLLDWNLKGVSNVISLCGAYAGLKRLFVWINSGEAKPELVEAAQTLLTPELIQNPTLAATWLVTQGLESVGTQLTITQESGVKTIMTKTTHGMVLEELECPLDHFGNFWNMLLRWIGLTNGGSRLTGLIMTDTMKPETYESLVKKLIMKTEPVYDIKDCGPNNRYRIREGLAHNCGYGMGHVKFRGDTFKKTGLRITEELSKRAVYAYRNKYTEITQFWNELEWAFKAALNGTTTTLCGGKIFVQPMKTARPMSKGIRVRLPSGGHLYYHDVQIDHEGLSYLSDEMGRPCRKKLYGGLLCEHVTSSTAREIIVPAVWKLEEAGFKVLSLVHDEIWGSAEPGRGQEFTDLMCVKPDWCADMEITADNKNGRRYLK